MPHPTIRHLNCPAAARAYGVTKPTMWRHWKRGDLPIKKLPGTTAAHVAISDLEARYGPLSPAQIEAAIKPEPRPKVLIERRYTRRQHEAALTAKEAECNARIDAVIAGDPAVIIERLLATRLQDFLRAFAAEAVRQRPATMRAIREFLRDVPKQLETAMHHAEGAALRVLYDERPSTSQPKPKE